MGLLRVNFVAVIANFLLLLAACLGVRLNVSLLPFAHKISVHFFAGLIFFIYLFFLIKPLETLRVPRLCDLLLAAGSLTFLFGLLRLFSNEYPGDLIYIHTSLAFVLYVLIIVTIYLTKKNRHKMIRLVSGLALLLLFSVSMVGGYLHKGANFYY